MPDAMALPDEGSQEGTAPVVDAPEGTTNGADSSPDPNDYEARIRSDPEFAVAEVKRQQGVASRSSDKLRKAGLAIQLAETLGGGDAKSGSEIALRELTAYRQLQQDPKIARLIERALAGERVSDELLSDDEQDPMARELSQVRGNQARVEQQLAEFRFEKAIEHFITSDVGKALTPEEREEFLDSARPKIQNWAKTPQGREQLQTFSHHQLMTLCSDWMIANGKLLDVGERAARGKAERLRQRETDGPSRSTKIGPDAAPAAASVTDAWQYAVRKMTGR